MGLNLMTFFKNIVLIPAVVQASWFQFGFCPWTDPAVVGDLKPELYAGNWYEIYRDKDVLYEKNLECVTATYSANTDIFTNWYYPIAVCNRKMTDGKAGDCTPIYARFDTEGRGHVRSFIYPEG